jgi:hypothetical protein
MDFFFFLLLGMLAVVGVDEGTLGGVEEEAADMVKG